MQPWHPNDPRIPPKARRVIRKRGEDIKGLDIDAARFLERGDGGTALALFRVLLYHYQDNPRERTILANSVGHCHTLIGDTDVARECHEAVVSTTERAVFQHASGREAIADSFMQLAMDPAVPPQRISAILLQIEDDLSRLPSRDKIKQVAWRIWIPEAQVAILSALVAVGEKQRVKSYYVAFQTVLKDYGFESLTLPENVRSVLEQSLISGKADDAPTKLSADTTEPIQSDGEKHHNAEYEDILNENDLETPSSIRMEGERKWGDGDLEGAIEEFSNALEFIESYVKQFVELGIFKQEERDQEIAKETMITLLRLGLCEIELNRKKEGLSHLRQATKLQQRVNKINKSTRIDLVSAYNSLLEYSIGENKYEDTVKLAEKADQFLPKFIIRLKDQSLIADVLGACVKINRFDLGEKLYRQLVQSNKLGGLPDEISRKIAKAGE